jgi:hypothetical protein
MGRTVALALAFLSLTGGEAQATTFDVVVVPGLRLSDLPRLERQGAVGLLVPGAGPETSFELARAALERGEVRNSLRGGLPEGKPVLTPRIGPLGSVAPPAIYLGLPEGSRQDNDRRYPVVVVGSGYRDVLVSESTRIPGLVSVADIAPTALGTSDALRYEEREDAASYLLALDQRIDRNNDSRLPATLVVCGLVVLLSLVFPRAAVPGLAAGLAANLALGVGDVSAPWAVLLVLALAVAIGGPLLALAAGGSVGLGLVLAAVLAGYLLAFGLDGTTVALSPLGPSQNARFYGLSNLLETMLLVPAFAAAALLAVRLGWAAFAAVAVLSFVVVAGNRFGADGGGAIVLAVGFAVLGVLLAGARKRVLALAVTAALALGAALVGLDGATGSSSHVTRALERGPGGLAADLRDRVVLSWERTTDTWFVALVIAALTIALVLLTLRTIRRRGVGAQTAVPLALAAAIAASLVVNDSPNDVLLAGITAYLAVERGMLAGRWPGPTRSRWSRSSARSPLRPRAAAEPRRFRPRPRT